MDHVELNWTREARFSFHLLDWLGLQQQRKRRVPIGVCASITGHHLRFFADTMRVQRPPTQFKSNKKTSLLGISLNEPYKMVCVFY
jgi:hypothetical protein